MADFYFRSGSVIRRAVPRRQQ